MKLAAVVILYFPSKDELKNIEKYIKEVDILYVIDNSKFRCQNKLFLNKKIKYIFNDENLGISKPLNIVANKARSENFEWLLTLDQDTKITDNIIIDMKKYIMDNKTNKKIGIVTPWHETKLKIDKPIKKVDFPLEVMTSGNIINLYIHDKIGGYDENLFIDGVDMEYCLNLSKNKFEIHRLNYLNMKHNLGDISYKQIFAKEFLVTNHSAIRRYYQVRNYKYIKDKYGKLNPEFCNKIVKFKGIIFSIIMYEKNKINKICCMIKGYRDYKNRKYGSYYEKNF